uniref:G-protein coupled receptors family 1 profile domain-containing protein n=1 Tax=Meloidogyne enterolobii TaxID=390850 RepID=A0A6V7VAG7_MELEN|nr:unnamed protein product [Meloidogyne enterolobii]
MNEGRSQNISSEVVAILPILPLPFEEEIILNNQTSLENNNLIEFTGTVVDRNPYALVLALVPVLTIFGNSMVILAVRKEKSLQSVTNYLIVSLASADLLVALCVMFFAVYYEWNSFVWDLGPSLCNLYIGADVACSTASILNLLAISIDSYFSPLAYCQIGANSSRACLSIALVWAVSIAVAVPVAFGANHIEQEHDCSFTNPVFMIGSSIFSFFVPCLAMIALYAVIFRRLREREKARDLRRKGQTSGTEGALVLNALMGDQLLLELSVQTSSFPSPSEEYEEVTEDGREKRLINSKTVIRRNILSPINHSMTNGSVKEVLPIDPLSLPQSNVLPSLRNGNIGGNIKNEEIPQNFQNILLVRRCNSMPSAIIRRRPSLKTIKEPYKTRGVRQRRYEINNNEPLEEENEEYKQISSEKLPLCSEFEENNCSNEESIYEGLSTHRSFGDGIQEVLQFIDSGSSASASPFVTNNRRNILNKQFSNNCSTFTNNSTTNQQQYQHQQPKSLPSSIEPKRKILLENNNNFESQCLLIYNQIDSALSLPNLLQQTNNSQNKLIIKEENNKNNNKIIEEEDRGETLKNKLTDWLRGIIEWSRPTTSCKEEVLENGFRSPTGVLITDEQKSTSTTGNRSVRIVPSRLANYSFSLHTN